MLYQQELGSGMSQSSLKQSHAQTNWFWNSWASSASCKQSDNSLKAEYHGCILDLRSEKKKTAFLSEPPVTHHKLAWSGMNAALTASSNSAMTKQGFGTLLPKTVVCRNHSSWFCVPGEGVGGTTFTFFQPLVKMILTSSVSASHVSSFFSSVTTDPARKPVLPALGSKPLINPLTLVFLMCQQLQSAFAVWLTGGIRSHSRGCLQTPCSVLCGWGRHSQLSAQSGWVQVFPKRTPQLLLGFPSPACSPGWGRDRWGGTAFFCASWPVSASNLHAQFSCRVNRDRLLRRHVGTNPSEHKAQAFSTPSGPVGWRLPSAASCHRTGGCAIWASGLIWATICYAEDDFFTRPRCSQEQRALETAT